MLDDADDSAGHELAADRREFMRHLAAMFAAAGAALGSRGLVHADQTPGGPAATQALATNLVGIQMNRTRCSTRASTRAST